MKYIRAKYPLILKMLYPGRISKVKHTNAIYLTFDDGPIPEVTPWVLDTLAKYDAKATFFCIGENVKNHPEIFQRIQEEDHCIGNHTYNHFNGWKTPTSTYIENTFLAEETMKDHTSNPDSEDNQKDKPSFRFFRPPYGKIKNSQAKALKKQGYEIVIWDVISGDYNPEFSAESCFKNVIDNTVPGSTIVLHDSIKAMKNLKIILPQILEHYKEKGFEFRSLKDAL
ncbi:polysaccharide deacetylase family protein [Gramella lutea]|uniref:Polysaccharide deacetylase family protein n=1 Tax=Christiangramia lutea TaxID=1607951 RepID=A0A9X1V0L5_9FLAO|nr:polysaccharide deacetylase family protein [Christiangramia lutea]MCH4821988.1 polysaccharide deacetylase family protein [Christiangramia lutea]